MNYIRTPRLPAYIPPVRASYPASPLGEWDREKTKQIVSLAIATGVGMLLYKMFLEPESKQSAYNKGYAKGYDAGAKDARFEEMSYGETWPGLA